MRSRVLTSPTDPPPGFALSDLPAMAPPTGVLLCPPDHFDVVDVKNPLMEGQVGRVDRALARRQWDALCAAFRELALTVETVTPTPGCEDMVFTANQTLTGTAIDGTPLCLLSRMRHRSRQREVPAFGDWFARAGYRVLPPPPGSEPFEGGGDALWHPARRLLWFGHGFRSAPGAARHLAETFDCPVAALSLRDPRFYHLDTCLCLVDESTALVVPGAFAPESYALIETLVPTVIEVEAEEAAHALACNAAAFPAGVVAEERAVRTTARLRDLGHRVLPVDTGEFLRSGGSVFCMKQVLFRSTAG